MALDITREELRDDMRKITTEVVTEVVDNSRRKVLRTINEDLLALSRRIDNVGHRVDKTNQLLRAHITGPHAHSRS
jgi:hypothetical protein